MTDKGSRHAVRFFTRAIRRHVFGLNIQRLANTYVANFTTVDDIDRVHTYLMTKNGVVEVIHLADQPLDLRWTQSDQVVLEIIVTLLGKFGRFFEQLSLATEKTGLLFPQVVEELLKLIVIHLLGDSFPRTIRGRQFHLD